jgi:hypothetical protein
MRVNDAQPYDPLTFAIDLDFIYIIRVVGLHTREYEIGLMPARSGVRMDQQFLRLLFTMT